MSKMTSIPSNSSISTRSDMTPTPDSDVASALVDNSDGTKPGNNSAKLFASSGFAKIFKKSEPVKAVPFMSSPSPTLMRDFEQRRKTILNTFCLSPRKKFDEDDKYRLYRYTISQKAKKMYI